jgi:uncharacterized protein (TIGR02145 family)
MQQISKLKTIKIFLFAFLLFAAGTTNAQVGIGTPTPNASAQLDVSSTTKGFLPPRMTQAQRNAIASPVAGLTIWCKDCGVLGELQVYNAATWTNMSGSYPSTPISPTVTIGTQVWMTRNLDVATYRNGDTIPEVKDSAEWANLTTGAWCYYNNDPALGAIYGKLYNHAAVVDPRGLAPAGWHIPGDSYHLYGHDPDITFDGGDWKPLSDYLGGGDVAGSKMRASSLWNTPNSGVANESGFTALPGGVRDKDGSFNSIGSSGVWWSGGQREDDYVGAGVDFTDKYYVTTVLGTSSFDTQNFILL